jgi:uncharacterized protein (TIGR02266 family)
MPYNVRVQFRNASSFLVAYSVNLSRGGIFLESDHSAPLGSEITVQFAVPGVGPVIVKGFVSWRREEEDEDGPPGIGVEFKDMVGNLSGVIDRLVLHFSGVNVLLLCGDDKDRRNLTRSLKSIISTAEIVGAADPRVAQTLLDDDIDIAILDADVDPGGALEAVRIARERASPVPVVCLSSNEGVRARARDAGADEVTTNPPAFPDLRKAVVRALGRPTLIRET